MMKLSSDCLQIVQPNNHRHTAKVNTENQRFWRECNEKFSREKNTVPRNWNLELKCKLRIIENFCTITKMPNFQFHSIFRLNFPQNFALENLCIQSENVYLWNLSFGLKWAEGLQISYQNDHASPFICCCVFFYNGECNCITRFDIACFLMCLLSGKNIFYSSLASGFLRCSLAVRQRFARLLPVRVKAINLSIGYIFARTFNTRVH